MSSSTSLMLGPAGSSDIPTSPALHLLPFRLGTQSQPYTTTNTPLSQYFIPRTAPEGLHGVPAGSQIASFRGRQLVGQTIAVPPSYRGVILHAPAAHLSIATAASSSSGKARHAEWPLTPASSSASVMSAAATDDDGTALRRSGRTSGTARERVRGAGQQALARPKRGAVRAAPAKKRFRLDSDSEEEDNDDDSKAGQGGRVLRTPSKRARHAPAVETPKLRGPVPDIVVQEATPLKEPLPPGLKSLRSAAEESMPPIDEPSESLAESDEPLPTLTADSANGEQADLKEEVIPSPATEDLPPAFPVLTPQSSVADLKPQLDEDDKDDVVHLEEHDAYTRQLRPTSTFTEFTLWTPDAPLAGFRADEQAADDAAAQEEEDGVKLEKGWWRTGGAGEGGDEVVRGLGEFIGLMEVLNKPTYLDEMEDDGNSDDDAE